MDFNGLNRCFFYSHKIAQIFTNYFFLNLCELWKSEYSEYSEHSDMLLPNSVRFNAIKKNQ